MTDSFPVHNKAHPFLASVKKRYSLCRPGSMKNTQHVVLDIQGSGLHYQIGDSLGIFPINDPDVITKTLAAMKAKGNELVREKNSDDIWTLHEFLKKKANITDFSRKLLLEICTRQTDPIKKAYLEHLLSDDHKNELKEYLNHHELWNLLENNKEVSFELQELCNFLMPLLPRLYSISSSKAVVGDEVHLAVALLRYETNGHQRKGVCTHYVCELVPLNEPVVPVYIQPHHGFTLPEDPATSIIMVGPGTGIAPFRAFMQERAFQKASGKNWLFFGEWNREYDFFYEEFWNKLEAEEKLHLDVAFSRDQKEKIYVQHRMLAHGAELYRWLQEGAYLYVCGDAQRMAKDVEATLHQIVLLHGNKTEEEAKAFIKQLRTEKRYLRDVY